ncbi:MAG: NAD(P)/FAD-dependent oxidoreductase [Candidatus Acidiferrales bacterium]
MTKRIVVLGGGFGGVQTAMDLSHLFGKSGAAEIWLVSGQNYFLFTPLLPQIASSNVDPRHIAQPVRDLRGSHNFRFLRATVSEIDLNRREVCFTGQTGPNSLAYDNLVIAFGSRTDYFGIPGARENTVDFKSLEDAVVLRERVLDLCEHADHTPDPELRRRLLTFAVVGGGYTGVELITELQDLLFGYVARRYRGLSREEIRLVLLEASADILRGVHPRLAAHSRRRLAKKGIEVRTNAAASKCFAGGVELKSGEVIFAETVVWTAGVRAHELVESLPAPHDRIGRALCNEHLQLEGHPEVFVIGDSAAAASALDAPRVAPVAIAQGRIAARNIAHQLRGEPLESYKYISQGMLISLGMNYAVVNIAGIRFSGYFAWLFWNMIHLYKLVGLKKQLQVAVDWFLGAIFQRDAAIVRRPRNCPYCGAKS